MMFGPEGFSSVECLPRSTLSARGRTLVDLMVQVASVLSSDHTSQGFQALKAGSVM